MCGEGVRRPTTRVQGQSFVLINLNFRILVVKIMILTLAFGALNTWEGFEVWLLNGCDPNLCFPKALG